MAGLSQSKQPLRGPPLMLGGDGAGAGSPAAWASPGASSPASPTRAVAVLQGHVAVNIRVCFTMTEDGMIKLDPEKNCLERLFPTSMNWKTHRFPRWTWKRKRFLELLCASGYLS
ncbi:hypothetical protein VULLAG_LOCUS12223 [Vulpes lagopus]